MKVAPSYRLHLHRSRSLGSLLALLPSLALVAGVSLFALMLQSVRPDWLPTPMAWPMALIGLGLLINVNHQWRQRQQTMSQYHWDWRYWQQETQDMASQLEAQLDTRQRVAKNLHERVIALLLAQVTVIRHTLAHTSASEDLHLLLDSLSCKRLAVDQPAEDSLIEPQRQAQHQLLQLQYMINEEAVTAQRLGLIDSVQWQTFDHRLAHQGRLHQELLAPTRPTEMSGLSTLSWGYILLLPLTLAGPLGWLALPTCLLATALLMIPQNSKNDFLIEPIQALQQTQSALIEILGHSPWPELTSLNSQQ
ncbi:hypothetical protein BFW38_17315 [Terasakiispira papahanaumokuakeensis]|uniref:Uncharacterized protein n=1 Tax=Terasakiispira papahanaumokuakeensis TaxID=197479 RepID=A0A1E2VDH4_9GAMM|nr:hypothetical protein [Terasakiispira papahanaumokuakeensis]ODC05031.1 hypothetical protein BFW38_17315 [Terasakiispira papahanaumokuakeensis]